MTQDPSPSADPQTILASLRQSVHKALERKQRLQHYAVIWENNAPCLIGADAPNQTTDESSRLGEEHKHYNADEQISESNHTQTDNHAY